MLKSNEQKKTMAELNSYTFEEILENRIRIKQIKDKKFLSIFKLCKSFGELMFFDVLPRKRSFVYASYVQREDAIAAMTTINSTTNMIAEFNAIKERESENQLYVLDITKLDEFEMLRSHHNVNIIFFSFPSPFVKKIYF